MAACLVATPAAQHRTALLLGCKLAHPPACGLFICSFISSRSLYERVCQNGNRTNSAKLTLRACFVKLTLRACSVKLLLPVCCCCRLFSPAARASCPCQQLRHGAQASTSFPMELRCNSLASNSSAIAPRPAASSRWCFATAPLPAASSRWLFAAAPLPVAAMPRRSLQQHLCYGAPASNTPHPAEKSTPVWLAISRTWAGFADSQLQRADFSALIYIYASVPSAATLKPLLRHSKSFGPSAPIVYATSVSPPNEAVAWPVAQVSGAG